MFIENATIISNKKLTDGYFVLTLESPNIARSAKPGQFVNVKVSNTDFPLLRRPISIYDADVEKGELKILCFAKGLGTSILSEKLPGDTINLTGPHGNSFTVLPGVKKVLLVGGGFGTAPLSFFAKMNTSLDIVAAVGGRTKELIFCIDDFDRFGAKTLITTEDGTLGEKGLVTRVIAPPIEKKEFDAIYTVGPKPMMAAVAKLAKTAQISCFVSMEERMACGVGNCKGCVCKTQSGYQTVCTDGPIFNASDLEFS